MDTEFTGPKYFFDSRIYENRVYNAWGNAHPEEPLVLGPNIKDWPSMSPLPENLLIRVVSEIHDPVTTTDELIPSGETSSYRSNPLGLAQFTLSRKDPAYVGRAKEVQTAQKAIEQGQDPVEALTAQAAAAEEGAEDLGAQLKQVFAVLDDRLPGLLDEKNNKEKLGIGSAIFAVKPGDGSAREQAASCQKVLGGWCNIAFHYATKRYRSNLINWGMLPLLIREGALPFENGDWILLPDIRAAVLEKREKIFAFVVKGNALEAMWLTLGDLTDHEREIIADGCLINYNRAKR